MVLFREAWTENVQLLVDSVEALVPLTLFMTVVGRSTLEELFQVMKFVHFFSEVHVREDSQRFMQAVEGGDGREMKKVLRIVRGRTLQLLRMVRESLAGNSEAYGKGQLSSVENTMQALREKCELAVE